MNEYIPYQMNPYQKNRLDHPSENIEEKVDSSLNNNNIDSKNKPLYSGYEISKDLTSQTLILNTNMMNLYINTQVII